MQRWRIHLSASRNLLGEAHKTEAELESPGGAGRQREEESRAPRPQMSHTSAVLSTDSSRSLGQMAPPRAQGPVPGDGRPQPGGGRGLSHIK